MKLSHRERLERTLGNEKPDLIPISFWNHFPVDDQQPTSLARATVHFQETFDFDFVKVSPSSSFCIKDWGARDIWNGNSEGTRDYLEPIVKKPDDWLKFQVLDPTRGHLGNQLECLKLIKQGLPGDTPIIQTVFNPLSQAKNLAGKSKLIPDLRMHPEHLQKALDVITKTTRNFMEACTQIGIDGFFFAVQHGSYDLLSESEVKQFVNYYDAQLFDLLKETWLNMLHIHGTNIMFDQFTDYPVQIYNWHDRETEPNLKLGKKLSKSVVCGGLSRIETMVRGDNQSIRSEIEDAIHQTGGTGVVIGTGCVLPLNTPLGNIQNAVEITRSMT